ncbi:TPR repeat containing exported protein; Putative periplasmic protein contains a protein prenylyltransferase domain [Thioalkalivibrio nitratireducens DSM 14787]|uniref:Cell division coordinator CpoB n=1 Tax=Thioalkalivibrio nitratireducens (strain DSM 14787 / UNIQEM 213 / ALEN2) TaxID=1255043 RepID=L0E129_THIND|nr:tol-pal system protein YbgF [Thioalkalivibrio nitratireducens]AGA35003.1 TPR repeat containing exported protein; Putative periplasmic protein contains a protein prenylyltransferase domain [Thioalkalivibrio nitratireducens DSM 14787]
MTGHTDATVNRWTRGPVTGLLGLAIVFAWTPAGAQSGSPVVTQHQLQMVETRLDRVERLLDSGVLTEMLQNTDALQAELRQLRGQVERLQHEVRSLRAGQRAEIRALEERLGLLEGDRTAPEPEPPEPEVIDTLPDADEQGAYQAAFDQLMSGDYPEAILQLERFMERYPDGVYSANALYWLGEAKYASQDYEGALVDFQAVRDRFPDSDKASDALLKIGYSHFELGHADPAREALNRVVSEYPGTTLSRLAQDRLRRLEGR